MQALTPIGLLPCQIETLKTLVEKAITQEYNIHGFTGTEFTQDEIEDLRYMIKLNRDLCKAGDLRETRSKAYLKCLKLTKEIL